MDERFVEVRKGRGNRIIALLNSILNEYPNNFSRGAVRAFHPANPPTVLNRHARNQLRSRVKFEP